MITVEAEEITDDLVEAVRYIKKYCDSQKCCNSCRLRSDTWGKCIICDVLTPGKIQIEEIKDVDV